MNRTLLAVAGLTAVATSALAAAPVTPSYAVTDRIKGPDGGWDYVSFDPTHRRVYVSRAGGVLALDVDSGAINPHLADAQRTHAVLPLNSGAMLLVTDSGTNSAHLIDAISGASLGEVPTGQKPDSAAFDAATGLALAMNGKSGDATLIDPATKTSVGSIAIGGALEAADGDGAGKVFVNIEDQNQVAVLDVKAKTVAARYSLKGCDGPSGLAYASNAGVVISACANKVAKVTRASDGQDIATLPIGAGPDSVIYDPDRQLAFIPCGRDGVLEVIAVRGPNDVAVVQTVKTQAGARTGAVDPRTGKLYLPTAKFTPSPTGGRPIATPGTFEILVVSPSVN